jgi:hypothetical protein
MKTRYCASTTVADVALLKRSDLNRRRMTGIASIYPKYARLFLPCLKWIRRTGLADLDLLKTPERRGTTFRGPTPMVVTKEVLFGSVCLDHPLLCEK